MEQDCRGLKERYTFSDFLFYTCLLAVPLVTAVAALWRHSPGWAVGFVLLAIVVTGLLLRYFCTRCPHYTRDEPLLRCIFFWGLPKPFPPRHGALDGVDKLVTAGASALLLLFPVYWLLMEPWLLVVYLLSLAGFAAAVHRNECPRCIYTECPANRAVKNG